MIADKKLVALYGRKSRLKNDDEMEIARQIELLTDYADANNMEYKTFLEEGSSEDWEGRLEFQKMLKELESGIYDGVLVTEQDRIARDSTDMGLFKRLCIREGLLLFTLNKTYDFSNDDDNFMTGIVAEMDSQFMRVMKRKMLRGRIQALENGVYFGYPPFGYDKSPVKPKILIRNPVESKAIEMIFDLYVNQNVNQTHIADKLNLLGYKTRENKDFTSRSISIILSNVAYKGTLYYELKKHDPITVEDAHEAIISDKLFNEAQVLRGEKRIVPQQSKKGRYLLSQLIKCPNCGTTLSFCMKYITKNSKKSLNKDKREAFVLNCHSSLTTSKQQQNHNRCSNMGVKASRIEDFVIQSLKGRLIDLDEEICLITQNGNSMFEDIRSQIKQIDARIAQLDVERKRVQNGYKSGIYDDEEAKIELKAIKDDGIKLELDKEKIEKLDVSSEIKRMQDLKEKISLLLSNEDLGVAKSNDLLKEIIECVYYYKDKPDNHMIHPMKIDIKYK